MFLTTFFVELLHQQNISSKTKAQLRSLSFQSVKWLLTVQAEGDVNGADVSDSLEVWDAGALQVCCGRGFSHIYPADSFLGVDEVHSHGLLSGDGGQPGCGAAQGGAADVMEVSDQQHRQTVHRLWGGAIRKAE